MQPKISIIVPVYNKKEYLNACVDSLLAQDYPQLEILLVDDESTDGSAQICDSYADREQVQVIHQQNAGPTAAVLRGMQSATGEYYLFVDSDDYVSEDMVSCMVSRLQGIPGEIVCCNHVLEKLHETLQVSAPAKPGVYIGEALQSEMKEKLLGEEYRVLPVSRCMKLFHKSVFQGNEIYYENRLRMGDDFNLTFPALLKATRIVVMEDAFFYHYRYVEGSLVHSYRSDLAQNADLLYDLTNRILQDFDMKDGQSKLLREYTYNMLFVLKNELRNPDQAAYRKRIQEILSKDYVADRIRRSDATATGMSNRLLLLGLRHPNRLFLWGLHTILKIHDA